MKRNNPPPKQIGANIESRLQSLNELVGRAQLAIALGQQYGGDRNIYTALGYDTEITFDQYAARYARQAIARAVINRPVAATWQGGITLMESKDAEATALEKAWLELEEKLSITAAFSRVDKLAGVGHYGILLLGLNDVSDPLELIKPVAPGKRELLYIKPLSEKSAEIQQFETEPTSERYGLPLIYKIFIKNIEIINGTLQESGDVKELNVHYSRVIHVAGELLESETIGTPRLQAIWNNLMNLDKVVGGSAEMFWRNARPGMQGKIDPDFEMTPTMEDDLKKQIDEYEKNLRRTLFNAGIEFEAFQVQVADPIPSMDVQIQEISAETGIPKRILTGTERGELASTQDTEQWHGLILARREDYAEPQIVRPFVNFCIEYQILPAVGEEGYDAQFKDLWALSEKEKAEVAKIRAGAVKDWGNAGVGTDAVPMAAVAKIILGLDDEDAELLIEMQQSAEAEEEREMRQAEEDAKLETARLAREGAVIEREGVEE